MENELLHIRTLVLSSVFALVLSNTTAQAHHSVSGTYATSKVITIEGVIREFHFVNPHPFLLVEVMDANGTSQMWRLEMDRLADLSEAGMKKTTFKAGDHIIAGGNPGISEKQSLFIRKLERPADGFRYEQLGVNPRIISKPN
jgi:hypothetical protein